MVENTLKSLESDPQGDPIAGSKKVSDANMRPLRKISPVLVRLVKKGAHWTEEKLKSPFVRASNKIKETKVDIQQMGTEIRDGFPGGAAFVAKTIYYRPLALVVALFRGFEANGITKGWWARITGRQFDRDAFMKDGITVQFKEKGGAGKEQPSAGH